MENNNPIEPKLLKQIEEAIRKIQYGSVEIVIHNSRIVQIECREKIRWNNESK